MSVTNLAIIRKPKIRIRKDPDEGIFENDEEIGRLTKELGELLAREKKPYPPMLEQFKNLL